MKRLEATLATHDSRLTTRELRSPSPNQRLSGFSLLELMVALVAGAIVITSIYYIGGASAQHFHEQQRIAQMQMGLRVAMDQVRRDIERAGFLGTPNSNTARRCAAPALPIQAITFADNTTADAANGVSTDTLTIIGNYATSDAYLVSTVSGAGTTVFLQRNWQSFQRSFGVPFDGALFAQVFAPGRMLRIRSQDGIIFVTITGSNAAAASVNIVPGLPIGTPCAPGLMGGSLVSPLSRIRYSVQNVGGQLAPLNPAVAAFTGAQGEQLVREEIAFAAAAAPIAGTQRVVLDYAIDFNVQFIADAQLNPTLPPNLVRGAAAQAILAVNPQQIRGVIVSLSARTAQQDPRFPFVAPTPGAPPTRWRVNATAPGAARVRTLRSEIFLPNMLDT